MSPDRLRSAADIIAASKCLLSRGTIHLPGWKSLHRESDGVVTPCRFCDVGTDYLREVINEGNRWNDANHGAPFNDFEKLSRPEQERRARLAQYPAEDSVLAQ